MTKIFYFTGKCDKFYDCVDKSDQSNCSCPKNQFQCQCYKNNPVDCKGDGIFGGITGCIPIEKLYDGIGQCSDGSDENYQFKKVVNCGQCNVTINSNTYHNLISTYHNLISILLFLLITQHVTTFLLFTVLQSIAMKQILFVSPAVFLILLNNVIMLFNAMMVV